MGVIIEFLVANYIYVIFIGVILVLALIGYIVDKSKTKKFEEKLMKSEEPITPLASIDSSVKLGETVNRMETLKSPNVNNQGQAPIQTRDDTPKLGV